MVRKDALLLLLISVLSLFVISGCGNNEEENNEENNQPEEVLNEPEEEQAEEPEEIEEPIESEVNTEDFSNLISYMEESTEGEATVIYENNEQETVDNEGITTSLNRYVLVELEDYHTDFDSIFNSETDGGVIIAEYTIENNSGEEAYYMTKFHFEYTGSNTYYNHRDYLIPEEFQLVDMLSPSTDFSIKANETITGYYAYAFGSDVLDEIIDLSTVTIAINPPHSDKEDVNSLIGDTNQIVIPLNDDGEAKSQENEAFYEDSITYDDMGEKKMIKEKSNINESEMLRDVKVTLDGYQFVDFTPNKESAPSFADFENGVVLLTVRLLIDNDGDEEIEQGGILTKLTFNDGMHYMRPEIMLLPYGYSDFIDVGQSDEILQIFVLEKEQYDKIWKDKSFELEVGPFTNREARDISKGNTIEFSLPE